MIQIEARATTKSFINKRRNWDLSRSKEKMKGKQLVTDLFSAYQLPLTTNINFLHSGKPQAKHLWSLSVRSAVTLLLRKSNALLER